MERTEALEHVRESVLSVVPDADFSHLPKDQDLRDAFELDSLDFLSFVETLSDRTGCPVAEDDYPALTTLSACAEFLLARTA
jgi:acyl carrier protein